MLFLTALLSLSSPALASEIPCGPDAKLAAIQAYRMATGHNSEILRATAEVTGTNSSTITYQVSVSSENLELHYQLKMIWMENMWNTNRTLCQVMSLKKLN